MAKNFYPEKPIIPYKKTSVDMPTVIAYINSIGVDVELKRSVYIFFRNESQNGQKGINNNYAGVQADSGRWQSQYDDDIVGIVVLNENQTGKQRLFCAFKDFKASVDFLIGRLKARGLYVGGTTHKIVKMEVKTPNDLAIAYQREWVTGNAKYNPPANKINNFLSMYKQAQKLFP